LIQLLQVSLFLVCRNVNSGQSTHALRGLEHSKSHVHGGGSGVDVSSGETGCNVEGEVTPTSIVIVGVIAGGIIV